jgi:hypothetical protein
MKIINNYNEKYQYIASDFVIRGQYIHTLGIFPLCSQVASLSIYRVQSSGP